ncbi:PHD finger protein ALFIN-LIKE 3 [Glycine soja]
MKVASLHAFWVPKLGGDFFFQGVTVILKKRLFNMINELPTIFEVVTGTTKKVKEMSSVSNHSGNGVKSSSKACCWKIRAEQWHFYIVYKQAMHGNHLYIRYYVTHFCIAITDRGKHTAIARW